MFDSEKKIVFTIQTTIEENLSLEPSHLAQKIVDDLGVVEIGSELTRDDTTGKWNYERRFVIEALRRELGEALRQELGEEKGTVPLADLILAIGAVIGGLLVLGGGIADVLV